MRFRAVGGLMVSEAGLGCNNLGITLDAGQSAAVVGAALDQGVNHFDTADVYGDGRSEEYLGRALGPAIRHVVVTTKFGAQASNGMAPGSRPAIRASCEASLRRLKAECIYLLLQHYPDPLTPWEETLAALEELRAEGKIREYGASNLSPRQLEAAIAVADVNGFTGLTALQVSYSLLDRTAEHRLLGMCTRKGIAVLPCFPLASGVLTGKYLQATAPTADCRLGSPFFKGRYPGLESPECEEIVRRLSDYASSRGRTLTEIALTWLTANPVIASVIAGARTPAQVRANVAAMRNPLTGEERACVDAITTAARTRAFTEHARSPDLVEG